MYRGAFFRGSDLEESIRIEIKVEEQRLTFVGGLQEHCDLTCMDSCKNKGFRHQKLCNNSPCLLPLLATASALLKSFKEFGGVGHVPPISLLYPAVNLCSNVSVWPHCASVSQSSIR